MSRSLRTICTAGDTSPFLSLFQHSTTREGQKSLLNVQTEGALFQIVWSAPTLLRSLLGSILPTVPQGQQQRPHCPTLSGQGALSLRSLTPCALPSASSGAASHLHLACSRPSGPGDTHIASLGPATLYQPHSHTCSLVVRPLATSTTWNPVRPATGMKNKPATHITTMLSAAS